MNYYGSRKLVSIHPFAVAALTILLVSPAVSQECPPAEGFDAIGSDSRAIEIADQVMKALGGCDAWQQTHCVAWNFFGRRYHVWDRWTGDIRVESEELTVIMNLRTGEGRAWRGDTEIPADSLAGPLENTRAAWINDAYWLFMPYKLKDTGVTLKYLGERETTGGTKAEVIQLTFKDVGVTPQNKYHVYVDPGTHMVVQWDYFDNFADAEPAMSTPWTNWQRYGSILLSDDRGRGKITDIGVYESVPDGAMSSAQSIRPGDQ